jgi:hypothetical protein
MVLIPLRKFFVDMCKRDEIPIHWESNEKHSSTKQKIQCKYNLPIITKNDRGEVGGRKKYQGNLIRAA